MTPRLEAACSFTLPGQPKVRLGASAYLEHQLGRPGAARAALRRGSGVAVRALLLLLLLRLLPEQQRRRGRHVRWEHHRVHGGGGKDGRVHSRHVLGHQRVRLA